ncbi:MAG: YMGG-like glycine zipper-containing protein [Opitutaceae bacterium]
MNKIFFPALTSLTLLLTGCVGSGPNTEQGALAGGALGAIAGGIIGNNSRGGDTIGGAIIGSAVGAIAGGTIGNSVDHERGTIYGTRNERVGGAYGYPDDRGYRRAPAQNIPTPPPTPIEAAPPSPASNAVWIAGYWIYDGRSFAWTSGHWEIPPPLAHIYVPAHSEVRNGQTVFVPGYWQ